MPRFFNKLRSTTALIAASGLAVFGLGVPAHAAGNQFDNVTQSIVYVSTVYPTTVSVPFQDGTSQSFSFTNGEIGGRCSGSIVSDTGYILTAAHCVQPGDETVKFARETTAEYMKKLGYDLGENPYFDGWQVSFGTPSVYASQPQHTQQNAFTRGTIQVRVVNAQTVQTGDLALLQLSSAIGLTPLSIASAKPAVGDKVTSVGFPALTDNETSSRLQDPMFKPLTVTRHATSASTATPVLEVDGEILGGMSGGPTINADGQIVGVNSRGFTGRDVSYITDTDDMNSFLQKNGVTTTVAKPVSPQTADTPANPDTTAVPMPAPAPVDQSQGISVPVFIGGIVFAGIIVWAFIWLVWPKLRTRKSSPARDNVEPH